MRRGEGERLLAIVDETQQSRDDRLRALAALERKLAETQTATAEPGAWKVRAAETFVYQLQIEMLHGLDDAVRPVTRERLEAALLGGPRALQSLHQAMAIELRQAEAPRHQLALLQLRLRCLELRRACLQHLAAIFSTPRAQP